MAEAAAGLAALGGALGGALGAAPGHGQRAAAPGGRAKLRGLAVRGSVRRGAERPAAEVRRGDRGGGGGGGGGGGEALVPRPDHAAQQRGAAPGSAVAAFM